MSVRVSTDWSYRDMQTIILENDLIRIVCIPDLGGKIWQITEKSQGKDMLWHNPRIKPRPVAMHASYDDHFYGGWDELFPNDIAELIQDESMPDHGEVWSLPWDYEVQQLADEVIVHLWVETPISVCRMEKWIKLRTGEWKIRFEHKLTNHGDKPLPFLWKLHIAMQVDEYARIDAGAKQVYIEDFGTPRNGQTQITYTWPYAPDAAGRLHDMRLCLPDTSRTDEFQYMTEMDAGWCSLTDTRSGIGLGLAFDTVVFRSCWLFAAYGGWRKLNTVVLEPCTGYPVSVQQGIEAGTHRLLASGQSIQCEVIATIYTGLKSVTKISTDGDVTGEPIEINDVHSKQGGRDTA